MQLELDSQTQALLETYGFDRELFADLRARFLAGELSVAANRLRGSVEPPMPGDLYALPQKGSEAHRALSERGLAALRGGEVGCVVLAGGMATRFGGVVKAEVEAVGGRSFLALKLADIRRVAKQANTCIPVFVMSSFATHDALLRLAATEQSAEAPIEVFPQMISLRLTPEGGLFREAGRPSPYAPGHGDLTFALRKTGILARFLKQGGRVLMSSNVDNVGATLNADIVGAHLQAGNQMTIEVGARTKGELGGAPARVDGRLQIVEDFRFPVGFDLDSIPYFNTNTVAFDARALDRDFALHWFLVRKRVGDREAIQLEHLMGELSAFLSATCLEVPRDGEDGRFQPAKDPEELARRKPQIERILRARGVL